jgi:putative effector of murein hydrolase LrgA (UPF0299 family)
MANPQAQIQGAHGARLADEGLAIVVAMVISTVLALAATALTVRALLRDDGRSE